MKMIKFGRDNLERIVRGYREFNFMAIDPGSKGGGVVFVDRKPVGKFLLDRFSGYYQVMPLVREHKISLFIMETGFIGKNAASALKLGFWRGYMASEIQQAARNWSCSIIEVSPTTWQAKLPRDGMPTMQSWDRDAKLFQTWRVGEQIMGSRPEHDAIASACGIAHWWLSITEKKKRNGQQSTVGSPLCDELLPIQPANDACQTSES